MSAAPTYLLFCDTPQCEETYLDHGIVDVYSVPRRLAKVRASAAAAGWTSRWVEPGAGHKMGYRVDTCAICGGALRSESVR